MVHIVYYSARSENTHRFVGKLGFPATRIPINPDDEMPSITASYVLIVPSYGGGQDHIAVPKQVIRFLNKPENRRHICGVIAAGNSNFGRSYAIAGRIVARKCQVPVLHTFELIGTPHDVETVKHRLTELDKI